MIKNRTRGRTHKTSLFMQPDYKCNLGCKGCYALKGGDYDSTEFIKRMVEIESLTGENMAEFDQITISFNDLDKDDAAWTYKKCKPFVKRAGKEKIHYACSVNSLETYVSIVDLNECSALNISFDRSKWNKMGLGERMEATDAMEKIIKDHPDLHININFLLELPDTEEAIDHDYLTLAYAEVFADSIHLIMNKPAKDLFNTEYVDKFKEIFEDYVKTAITYKKRFGDKIDVDACVKTLLRNLINDTTYTCRAGTDHISIWPEGKMTGCPYRMPETDLNGKAGSTLNFLDYDNISDVKISEFPHCLYNKLSIMYGSFEGLCDALDMDGKEIEKIKSLI